MNKSVVSKKHGRKLRFTDRFFRNLALISFFCVLVIVFLIVRVIVVYHQSRKTYQNVASQAISTLKSSTVEQPQSDPETTHLNFEREYLPAIDEDIVSEPTEKAPITVDWVSLHATNKQIVAWLYCEGTNLNYPILQGENNTYYLTHNVMTKADQAGALFLDFRNVMGDALQNLIVYGHRMKDGSMFGELAKFSDKSYCDKHSEFYLLTPEQDYKIDLIACRTVHGKPKYFPTSFSDIDAEYQYVVKACAQSYWQQLWQNKPDGAVLVTLATCSKYDFSDSPRLILHGWAIPIE